MWFVIFLYLSFHGLHLKAFLCLNLIVSDLYDSEEWKSLDLLSRAELIPVVEGPQNGGRPGCIISGDWSNAPVVFQKAGLAYRAKQSKRGIIVFTVARLEDLERHEREFAEASLYNELKHHEITGRFLGYPECCVREYSSIDALELDGWISKFDKELEQFRQDGIKYPRELEYAPICFTPCGVYCPSALETLGMWGEMIETHDPEAGRKIRRYNSISYRKGTTRFPFRIKDLHSLYRI